MKYRKIFDTAHLQDGLEKRSLRSGAVTLISQAAMFVIQLGSTMIIERIIKPQDFGMVERVTEASCLISVLLG